jgi:hypothetical protein
MGITTAGAVLSGRSRTQLIADVCSGEHLARHSATLILTILCFGGVYGAVLGLWRSPLLSLYVSIKFPLLLIITCILTSLFNWITASIIGLPIRYAQALLMAFFALAIAALILGSVAPIIWLMTTAAPPPSVAARTAHNVLYLLHTALVASAGFTGTAFLLKLLTTASGDRARARKIFAIWVLAFAITGGEVAWLLRPFVGSVYYPVVFIRTDSFKRNVYEFIASDIAPHLVSSITEDPCQTQPQPCSQH